MKRLETAAPSLMADIEADMGQIHAQIAMATRRLESSVEHMKAKTGSQLSEIGKSSETIARLKAELGEKTVALQVALAAPQLTAPPALDGNGMLRLTGAFPTRPLQINFDLLFQNVGGQWRLFGISVATPQVPAQPPQAEAPKAAPAKNAPAAKKK
jgi:hypothetical protein